MSEAIRIARLHTLFDYKTMQEIENNASPKRSVRLPHRHDFYTIIAVEKAIGKHQIDFKNYDLTPNTLYFIAPEQVHDLEILPAINPNDSSAEGHVKGHVVMFTTDFLLQYSVAPDRLTEMELFFNCDESKPLILNTADMTRLNVYFQNFQSENSQDNQDRWDILGAWLKLFLLECRRLKRTYAIENSKLESRQALIIRQFKDDVERHFKQWHQVSDYAQAQHLTANYLNEVIKAETQINAKDFITQRIILEAKRLARYSDMTVKEIAYALGYEDIAQFSKFFKKNEGVTFTVFRESSD